MNTQQGICKKCNTVTDAEWKTLCRKCWRSQTPEEIRAYRQAKLDRKIARLRKGATSRDAQATTKQSEFIENSKDWAYVTQPNINTSKGRQFSRYRERVLNKYDAGIRLQIEADDKREYADYLEKTGAVVKGDAERKRQALREEIDALVHVGDIVHSYHYQAVEILKKNKKTFTIKIVQTGSVFTIDKSYIEKPKT